LTLHLGRAGLAPEQVRELASGVMALFETIKYESGIKK